MKKLLIIIINILTGAAMYGQEATLRINYIFSGTDRTCEIAVDELNSLKGWAGRTVRTGEVPLRGNGQICMTSARGDTLVISKHILYFFS